MCDNLTTHNIASLYHRFGAATAHRLACRLRIEHTPVNGSWLNMAEMELSVLSRQCIGRRFTGVNEMESEIAVWQESRNRCAVPARWRFETSEARIKLQHLYPNG
ncbi:MAG: hypothetical protein HUJ26_07785 [Planctomycetaceae bacterium]|nr:hypothetical protein [Planctomycetaceae bacterium]